MDRTDGWENDATRGFAARHGFKEGSRAVQRRQLLADLDWAEIERMHARSGARRRRTTWYAARAGRRTTSWPRWPT